MWSAGQGDNQERFLADLRALRDVAAIGYDELAARAHYPSNILKEAENGPGLPGLPILAAYVRACDADVPEWEERWRRLEYEAQTDPSLPIRPAGASPAAVAGARAGVGVAPPDAYDPERIRAALRGGTSNRVIRDVSGARAAAAGRANPDPGHVDMATPEGPATWNSRSAGWGDGDTASWSENAGRGSVWDAAPSWSNSVGQDTVPTNGNHYPSSSSAVDTTVAEVFGAEVAPVTEEDPVRAWLADSEVAAQPEADRRWPEGEDTEPARWSVDGQLAPPVTTESEPGFAQVAGFAGTAQDAAFTQPVGTGQDAGFAGTAQDIGFTEPAHDAGLAGTAQETGFAGTVHDAEFAGSAQDIGFAGPVHDAGFAGTAQEGEFAGTAQEAGFAGTVHDAEFAGSAQDIGFAGPAHDAGFAGTAQEGEFAGTAQDTGFAGTTQDAGFAGVSAARAATQPIRPPLVAAAPDERRRDRYFPLRLVTVMVVAAIIGSVLVLVIR